MSYSSRTQVARRSTPRLTISGPFEGPIHTPRADLRIHRFAQDSVKPGQWVKLESGDHRCAIGKPVDIVHSVASVALTSIGDDPDLLIPLRALAPFYRYGDNVKCRWPGSCGLVTSVDEVEMVLTFVEKTTTITRVQILGRGVLLTLLLDHPHRRGGATQPPSATMSPGPPPRDSTPWPTSHWLFTSVIQSALKRKCVPFVIRTSGNYTLDVYDGKSARTLPIS